MNLNLLGKRVLVGGSTAGIGKAIAQAFASEGANVTLIARDKKKSPPPKKKIGSYSK